MPAAEYYGHLLSKVDRRPDLIHSSYPLVYQAGTWDFLRIASRDIGPQDKVVVVRATIHGEEIAGALTSLDYLDDLADYTHSRGLKLILYPLGNPSGFERGTRYNADGHVALGNNDFLRYVLEDGSISGDLGPGRPFRSWTMADDPALSIDLPAESRLMLQLVHRDPLGQIVAAFDLHQDVGGDLPAAAYHYAFGDLDRYSAVVGRIAEIVPLLAGYEPAAVPPTDGEATPAPPGSLRSDEKGFIVHYDGSFSDFYQRIGAAHSITAETTGATLMEDACRVNWTWMTGVIDLVTAEEGTRG